MVESSAIISGLIDRKPSFLRSKAVLIALGFIAGLAGCSGSTELTAEQTDESIVTATSTENSIAKRQQQEKDTAAAKEATEPFLVPSIEIKGGQALITWIDNPDDKIDLPNEVIPSVPVIVGCVENFPFSTRRVGGGGSGTGYGVAELSIEGPVCDDFKISEEDLKDIFGDDQAGATTTTLG
jgi:hypothetical protein